jgi:Fe2+ or Zn2+ uptake regulation protein
MPTTIDRPVTSTVWPTDLDTICRTALAGLGQRYTTGRERIVSALLELRRPVTIPQILAHDHELAQSSVYRNLGVLTLAGLTRVVPTPLGDHVHYELSTPYPWRTYAHCARCRTMHRLRPRASIDLHVEQLGPVLDTMTVLVVEFCGNCRPEALS